MLANMNVPTIIVLLIIIACLIAAIMNTVRHYQGDCGCCGADCGTKPEPRKRLEGKIIASKILYIDGMHCQNCKNSIEKAVNHIEGASCKVNLKKGLAAVKMDREIDEETLRIAIERLNFKVVRIKD